jgi:hypothetical protein
LTVIAGACLEYQLYARVSQWREQPLKELNEYKGKILSWRSFYQNSYGKCNELWVLGEADSNSGGVMCVTIVAKTCWGDNV